MKIAFKYLDTMATLFMPTKSERLVSNPFMTVHQVAEYLHLNEKKVYALVKEGVIPATKVTGKWMFPKELVDRWIFNSTHNGLLTDRLLIGGADDALLHRAAVALGRKKGSHALVSYFPGGTRPGLDLLQSGKVDVCALHWGPDSESHIRHPALLQAYKNRQSWVLVHAFKREQGLMVSRRIQSTDGETGEIVPMLINKHHRWIELASGSGTRRFVLESLGKLGISPGNLHHTVEMHSSRESGSAIAMNIADIAPGTRALASEFGHRFISLGWENLDLVFERGIWFRRLLQDLVGYLISFEAAQTAEQLGGYDLSESGKLKWGDD